LAVNALDRNKDGVIDADEIAKAAESLITLDKNGDGKLSADEYRAGPGGGGGRPQQAAATPAPALTSAPVAVASAEHPESSVPKLFNPKALVKPITEIEGTLSDGSKATVYKIVVRSLPVDHETGPWAPATINDKGGYWEDTVDKKLYRVDGDYLTMLNRRGWSMFESDGTVHRTKNRTEFDKVARQELAGWTIEQAKKDGVTNSVIELQPQEQIVTIFLPKNPKASAQPTMLRQARFSPRSGVGISVNGVRFFPPEPVNRITAFQNIAPLDPFGGHTGFGHEYHYHRAPASMQDDKSGKVVGWALDGFPIRGPYEPDGSKPRSLDAINGHDHDGLGYHYHAGDQWPYIVGGFHGPLGTAALGEVDTCDATQQGGGGPPGRGGNGPGGGRPAGGPPGAAAIPPAIPASTDARIAKPNVLVLIADDLGWGDVGFHKGNVPTPNLDRLAKEGLELQRFYVHPVCSPTRAALLSGQMPRRFGINDVMGPGQTLPAGLTTMPGTFRSAGYTTSLIGKWHLGKGSSVPQQFGFDHFYGFLGPEIDYFKHTGQRGDVDWQRDGTALSEDGYSTFLFADEAIRQIEKRDTKKPFFMQVAFNAVHVPLSAPDDLLAKYKNLGGQATSAAVLDAMDTSVGKILAALDKEKLRENTIVVFFSDNGASRRNGSNGPFRAGKGTLCEGGIHAPCIIRWPGKLAAGTSWQPLAVFDLFPTLAAAAGVRNDAKLDGINVWPALQNGRLEKRPAFAIANADIALIDGDWKLVESSTGERVLYNLATDISESKDEISAQPETAARLIAQVESMKKDLPAASARRGGPGGRPGPRPQGGPAR
jgi:arylsulfatase A-like enzyme